MITKNGGLSEDRRFGWFGRIVRQGLDALFHDIGEQINHAVGITPLVVIPTDEFEERRVELNRGARVEDRRILVVNEVSGNHFVIGVGKDSLEIGLKD